MKGSAADSPEGPPTRVIFYAAQNLTFFFLRLSGSIFWLRPLHAANPTNHPPTHSFFPANGLRKSHRKHAPSDKRKQIPHGPLPGRKYYAHDFGCRRSLFPCHKHTHAATEFIFAQNRVSRPSAFENERRGPLGETALCSMCGTCSARVA
jgi:hypothetical protein